MQQDLEMRPGKQGCPCGGSLKPGRQACAGQGQIVDPLGFRADGFCGHYEALLWMWLLAIHKPVSNKTNKTIYKDRSGLGMASGPQFADGRQSWGLSISLVGAPLPSGLYLCLTCPL